MTQLKQISRGLTVLLILLMVIAVAGLIHTTCTCGFSTVREPRQDDAWGLGTTLDQKVGIMDVDDEQIELEMEL